MRLLKYWAQRRRRERNFKMYTLDKNMAAFRPTDGQREISIIR